PANSVFAIAVAQPHKTLFLQNNPANSVFTIAATRPHKHSLPKTTRQIQSFAKEVYSAR
ncbi:hypothetical protein HMPREF1981_01536, partial [Bacteroides pyogenes F0041]